MPQPSNDASRTVGSGTVSGGATLTDETVLAILQSGGHGAARTQLGSLVDAGVAFVVLGLDRGESGRIDPAVAAQALARLEPRLGVFVTADPSRDHPYNLARRVLSLDHLTGGRAGLALVAEAPAGSRATNTAWSAGVTSADTPEFARLVATLWNTFPRDALVGDRETGLFSRSERVVRTEHRGRWNVDGPLNSPSSVQGTPPLLWWGSRETADDAGADLVVLSSTPAADDSLAARDVTVEIQPGRGGGGARRVDGEQDPASTLRERLGLAPRRVDVGRLSRAFSSAASSTGIGA